MAIPVIVQQQANARLRAEDDSLQSQTNQLARLQTEHERLAGLAANAALSKDQLNDLEKLRAEIGPLRQATNDLAALRDENRRLRSSLKKSRTPLQIREDSIARMSYSKDWLVAFYLFAEKNGGTFPTRFEQAEGFLPENARSRTDVTTDQFEIVFHGSPSALQNPQDIIAIREKESWESGAADDGRKKWARIYGFVDGHIEIHSELDNNFDAYEKQHMIAPPSGGP